MVDFEDESDDAGLELYDGAKDALHLRRQKELPLIRIRGLKHPFRGKAPQCFPQTGTDQPDQYQLQPQSECRFPSNPMTGPPLHKDRPQQQWRSSLGLATIRTFAISAPIDEIDQIFLRAPPLLTVGDFASSLISS
jgi:hypothetical protein